MIQNDPNSVKSTSAKCYLRSAMLKTPIGCSGKSCPHRNKSGSKPIGAPWAVRKVKKQIRRDMISMDPCNKMSAKIPKRLCEIICTPWKLLQRGEAHEQLPSAARNLSLSKKMVSSPQISLKRFHSGSKTVNPLISISQAADVSSRISRTKGEQLTQRTPGDLLALLLSNLGSRDLPRCLMAL